MPTLTPARAGKRTLPLALILLLALALCLAHAPSANAARGMELGFYDGEFNIGDDSIRTTSLDRAVQARAGWALIYTTWGGVAPGGSAPPVGFDATNPADPNYNWDSIDAAVRDASARGLKVLLAITRAPAWAEGPGRPSQDDAPPGTWKPNAQALGDFTKAIATRYSGHFAGLPAVRYWQLWAEPNLGVNLSPQFEGNTAVGYGVYRPMLDAFYANLKAVSPQNVVITGGTAPYGGLTPARGLTYQRMQPLTFWRGLLCQPVIKQQKKKKKKKSKKGGKKRGRRAVTAAIPGCTPPRFDVAAHHPINVGAPSRPALNPDDVSTPDIGKLRRVVRAGVGNKPIWATEIWWNSNPPGRGVSLKAQARYLEQSFYLLWKQRVPVAIWFEVRDALQDGRNPIPTCGVFFRDGRPKPSLQAFQFPFVTERLSKTRVRAWGIAPRRGKVKIGTGKGKRFHKVRTLKAGANRVFVGKLRLRGKARLRAKQGSNSSLVWRQS
jgi:hypothetical protein